MAGGKNIDQPFQRRILYDALRAFYGGMNGGVDPQSIPRTQAAFLRNATVRGTFPTHRPAYRKITLASNDSSLVTAAAAAVLGGASAFQGAAFHRGNDGTESLMAAVSGRLFRFVIAGTQAIVSELTTPSLAQAAFVPQCWLWQSERFLIFNDGINLPLFWDGVSLRRSKGSQTVTIGTTSGFTAPAPGTAVTIPLNGPYTGPLNTTVTIAGKQYIVVSVSVTGGSNYLLSLKNLKGGTGETVAAGTAFKKASRYFGFSTAGGQAAQTAITHPFGGSSTPAQGITIPVTADGTTFVGDSVTIINADGTVISTSGVISAASASAMTIKWPASASAPLVTLQSGTLILSNGNVYTTVATTPSAFTFVDPTPGNSVASVQIVNALTVPVNSYIFVGNPDLTAIQLQITQYSQSGSAYSASGVNVNAPQGTVVAAAQAITYAANELPAGRMGAYGLGRNWVALTDGKSFIAGDIVGGSSGSTQYSLEDAVLSVNENTYLAGGGTFAVPGQAGDIRAMIFTAQLDTSQGQGPLAVLTPNIVFSCNAPVDRSTWQNVTNPITTESVKANGGLSHYGTVNANSDTFYRSKDGIRSLILGRREFDKWGNVPASREVDFINSDNPALLNFCSAVEFDNRLLMTTGPTLTSLGTSHSGLIALNFDPISSLQGKAPAVYDGFWDAPAGGLLHVVKGDFSGVTRAFAFCRSTDHTTIELWEITRSDDPLYQDDTGPIQWVLESASLNFYENDERKRDFLTLTDGELRVDLMNKTYGRNGAAITSAHQIFFEVFYKGDQVDNWEPWYSFTQTYDPNETGAQGYRATLGLGEPSPLPADLINDSPIRDACTFQVKLQITGHCRLLGMRLRAHSMPTPDLASPADST